MAPLIRHCTYTALLAKSCSYFWVSTRSSGLPGLCVKPATQTSGKCYVRHETEEESHIWLLNRFYTLTSSAYSQHLPTLRLRCFTSVHLPTHRRLPLQPFSLQWCTPYTKLKRNYFSSCSIDGHGSSVPCSLHKTVEEEIPCAVLCHVQQKHDTTYSWPRWPDSILNGV